MKNVIYIVFTVVALGLASCSKQDVQPNSAASSDAELIIWKSLESDNTTTVTEPGSTSITDPELETEEKAHGAGN